MWQLLTRRIEYRCRGTIPIRVKFLFSTRITGFSNVSPEACHILAAPFTAVNEMEQWDDKSTAGGNPKLPISSVKYISNNASVVYIHGILCSLKNPHARNRCAASRNTSSYCWRIMRRHHMFCFAIWNGSYCILRRKKERKKNQYRIGYIIYPNSGSSPSGSEVPCSSSRYNVPRSHRATPAPAYTRQPQGYRPRFPRATQQVSVSGSKGRFHFYLPALPASLHRRLSSPRLALSLRTHGSWPPGWA